MRTLLRSRRTRPGRRVALGAIVALLLSGMLLPALPRLSPPDLVGGVAAASTPALASDNAALPTSVGPYAPVPLAPIDRPDANTSPMGNATAGTLEVVVSFSLSNRTELARALANESGRRGLGTPPYLTPAEFDERFGGAAAPYRAAAAYFARAGVSDLALFPDRASLSFAAPPATLDRLFHTTLSTYASGVAPYIAPTGGIALPASFAAAVTQVTGLRSDVGVGAPTVGGTDAVGGGGGASWGPRTASGPVYPTPPTISGVQYQYASDFQMAYDEPSLFAASGYTTNTSIALLTFAGTHLGSPSNTTCGGAVSAGADVGGWVPGDVSAYFASALPSGEPLPSVVPVPIGGAAPPGCFASWDTTGAAAMNTVALETVGALAPGATLYGVYGPGNATVAGLDADFAEVLNHAPYNTVSVVVTPWTFNAVNDSAWYADLQEAQALGISVVSATGDSGDDPASGAWHGNSTFPGAMAYSSFGALSVGGSTTTLNAASLQISAQTVWNVSAGDVAQGGPRGSVGGVSSVIAEPRWQLRSLANAAIAGHGRGGPDIAGVANNTAATVSTDGVRANALNASTGGSFFDASGTGVAAAAVAGELAEIDHALAAAGDARLGFPDPSVYAVANVSYGPLLNGNGIFTTSPGTGGWDSALPTLPFRDVVAGRNFAYAAATGYDLVTGWGALDAYNFTMYELAPTTHPAYGPLTAVSDRLALGVLKVAPYNGTVTASIQENLFVANSFGAPVDWVQLVLFMTAASGCGRGPGGYLVNFSASVAYPFFGIYDAPGFTLYTEKLPNGILECLPMNVNLTVTVQPGATPLSSTLRFSFGGLPTAYTIPAPGADYILGGLHHTYSWQGQSYTDGPYGSLTTDPGFLAPQFGVYGEGGGASARFETGTLGTVTSSVEPVGSGTFLPAQLFLLNNTTSQTGESSQNLTYAIGTNASASQATFGYTTGPWLPGVITAEPFPYTVNFSQRGTPTGLTWYVNASSGAKIAQPGAVASSVLAMDNGTYTWTAAVSSKNYSIAPASGGFVIAGGGTSVALTVAPKLNSVTFVATGPPFPFRWSVRIGSGPTLNATGPSAETNLTYAHYTYQIASGNSSWAASRGVGGFTIGSAPVVVDVTFALVTYAVKISPAYSASELDQASLPWTVTIGATVKTGSATAAFTFPLPNGSYSFSITGLAAGYHASPSSGSFVVNGKKLTIVVQIIAPPAPVPVWEYAAIAGAAAAAVAIVFVLRRRRRRDSATPREPPPPPPPRRGRPPRRRELSPDDL